MDVFARMNEDILDTPVKLIALDNMITSGDKGRQIPLYDNVNFVEHDVVTHMNMKKR